MKGWILRVLLSVAAGALSCHAAAVVGEPHEWQRTTWNGEPAYTSVSANWRAVVSLTRARLMYFGSNDGEYNLLFAPANPSDPAGWGGHRLWLGPQSEWKGGWPPAKAWEFSRPADVRVGDSRLDLVLADSGNEWPRLTRSYFWVGDHLHCEATTNGGTRPAQFIHILQVPNEANVYVRPVVTKDAPHGYVQVHLGRKPSPQRTFEPPPHVSEQDGQLRLRFLNRTEKLGFVAQALVADIGPFALRLERGTSSGDELRVPDDGYVTQVYLGGGQLQLIELEQLSPLYAPKGTAKFEVVVSASRRVPTGR